MTTEFADFVAQQDARNTIELNITKYCWELCDHLLEDFQRRHPNSSSNMEFEVDSSGRKYHKIWEVYGDNGSRSCHAFINKKTGEVFKPASYKAPAKIVRYNLNIISSREECFSRADWAGGYLYLR